MEKNMAKIAAECLDEHKAEDILTLDVSRLTPFADHYVIPCRERGSGCR